MIDFKTQEWQRLKREFDSEIDPRLRILLCAVAGYMSYHFGRDMIITHLVRTEAEQDKFYANNEQYQKAKWPSVHQIGCGADIRTIYEGTGKVHDGKPVFGDAQIAQLEQWIDTHFDYGDKSDGKPGETSIRHNIGIGDHLHLQVNPRSAILTIRRT